MSLQARILLAFGYLVLLVVLGAVAAAVGFRDLGTRIGAVLGENFESVQATTAMLEALEREHSAVLGLLIGRGVRPDLEATEEDFHAALERARANITLEGETEVIDAITNDYAVYREARERLLGAPPERPLQQYERDVFPEFEQVKADILRLIELNYGAMAEADTRAGQTATTRAAIHGLLVAVAVLSLAPLMRMIRRSMTGRVHELADIAEAIAGGDRHRRATVTRNDELGLVARQFNAVLDRLQQAESASEALHAQRRRLLHALLSRFDRPGAVISTDGRILGDTLDPEVRTAAAAAVRERIDKREDTGEMEVDAAGTRLRLLPLEAADGPDLGWLALVADDSPDRSTDG